MNLDKAKYLFLDDRKTFCENKTLEYYDVNLQKFEDFCVLRFQVPADEIKMESVDKSVFSDYVKMLRQRQLKNVSIRTYCRAVRTFSTFCAEYEIANDFAKKVKLPKSDNDPIIPIDSTESVMIDNCFDRDKRLGLRNYLIFHLMLDCGFRSQEVVQLRVKDLLFSKRMVQIYKTKNNKSRPLILPDFLASAFQEYIRKYIGTVKDQDERVFTYQGNQISDNTIKQMFYKLKKRSGVYRIHAHLCRHTFATSYIMGGGNMEMLRLMLGHCDYSVTKNYVHLAAEYQMMHIDVYKLDSRFFETNY